MSNNNNNNDEKSFVEKAKDVFSAPVEKLETIVKAKTKEKFVAPPVTAMFICPDSGGRVFISEEKIKCFNIKGDKSFKSYLKLPIEEKKAKLKAFRENK